MLAWFERSLFAQYVVCLSIVLAPLVFLYSQVFLGSAVPLWQGIPLAAGAAHVGVPLLWAAAFLAGHGALQLLPMSGVKAQRIGYVYYGLLPLLLLAVQFMYGFVLALGFISLVVWGAILFGTVVNRDEPTFGIRFHEMPFVLRQLAGYGFTMVAITLCLAVPSVLEMLFHTYVMSLTGFIGKALACSVAVILAVLTFFTTGADYQEAENQRLYRGEE